jgi:hypothetical protein
VKDQTPFILRGLEFQLADWQRWRDSAEQRIAQVDMEISLAEKAIAQKHDEMAILMSRSGRISCVLDDIRKNIRDLVNE